MKQLSRKRRVATWLATLLVLFLVVGLLPTGLSKEVMAKGSGKPPSPTPKPSLIIEKKVVGKEDAGPFRFTLKANGVGTDERDFDIYKDGVWSSSGTLSFHGTTTSFDLSHGEAIHIYGLDNKFELGEEVSEYYTTSFAKDNTELAYTTEKGQHLIKGDKLSNNKTTKITVINTYKSPGPDVPEPVLPSLIVEKFVMNRVTDQDFEFSLTVTGTKNYSYKYKKYKDDAQEPMEGELAFNNEDTATFWLASGERIEIYDLLSRGTASLSNERAYTLREIHPVIGSLSDSYTTSFTSGTINVTPIVNDSISGNITTRTTTITVTNTFRDQGTGEPQPDGSTLFVKKKVVKGPSLNKKFEFKIDIISPTAESASITRPFELGNGNEKDFKATPGAKYKITEKPVEGYEITARLIYGIDSESAEIYSEDLTVNEDGSVTFKYPDRIKNATVVFTNTWVGTETEEAKTLLRIIKQVEGLEEDDDPELVDRKYLFTLWFEDIKDAFLRTGEEQDISPDANNTFKFVLTHGQKVELVGLTEGTKFVLIEHLDDGEPFDTNFKYGFDHEGEGRKITGVIEPDKIEKDEDINLYVINTYKASETGDDPPPPSDPPGGGSDDPVDEPGDTPVGGPGEEPGDTPGGDPGGETPGGEIVAGDEDEKPGEVVKGDEDEKAEEEELDVPVTGEGLSSYPFLALAMVLLAAAFLALGRRKPLEED